MRKIILSPIHQQKLSFSQFHLLEKENSLNQIYQHDKFLPYAVSYGPMGIIYLLVVDIQNKYHCLVLEGSNNLDRQDNLECYQLYHGEKPQGNISDITTETLIIPYLMLRMK
jgi:hypothetical protein